MDSNFPENLHAYWRMDYVSAPKKDRTERKDLFSELSKIKDDKSAYILVRGRLTYILMNRFPYNVGHLLVVPYRNVNDLKELTLEERAELMEMLIRAQDILTQALNATGFNIGFNLGDSGGPSIPEHIHAHIVPRWKGDTNFMPVLANTKVLSCSLDDVWERLKQFC